MSGRMASSNQVAIAGYAQSEVERHAESTLGALTVEDARRAVADAGLRVGDVDGFVTASLFPTAGAHAAVDGVSLVSSNWLAEHLGVNPEYAAGFQGFGQLPGAVSLAVNAVVSGAADYVIVHRALHNPLGKYHANPMTEVRGAQQWTTPAGYFGPLSMIALTYNEYLQRYGAGHEAMAFGARGGSQERIPDPLVVLARKATPGGGLSGRADDQRSHLPPRLRSSRRRGGLFRPDVSRASTRPSEPTGLRGRLRHRGPVASSTSAPLALGRCHGGWTGDGPPALGALGNRTGGR